MSNNITTNRRHFIKIGGAIMAAIPILALTSRPAVAATNAAMRTAMKYQDTPNAEKSCAGCLQFVPGKTATANGGCKIFPGDTEVSPHGYCIGWTAKPK